MFQAQSFWNYVKQNVISHFCFLTYVKQNANYTMRCLNHVKHKAFLKYYAIRNCGLL